MRDPLSGPLSHISFSKEMTAVAVPKEQILQTVTEMFIWEVALLECTYATVTHPYTPGR